MTKKLNEEYFKTKKKHKENYKNTTLTFQKRLQKLLIAFIFIFVWSILQKSCQDRIAKNKAEDTHQTKSHH